MMKNVGEEPIATLLECRRRRSTGQVQSAVVYRVKRPSQGRIRLPRGAVVGRRPTRDLHPDAKGPIMSTQVGRQITADADRLVPETERSVW